MKSTILALLLVAGGAIGLALPSSSLEENAEEAGTGAQDEATKPLVSGNPEAGTHWGTEARLQRAYDGHFYAEVYVNGAPTRMLVDTGASVIALTGDDASTMGIYWDYSALSVVAQGASGPIEGVQVRLPQVELDGFVARDVAAIVVPDGLPVSLLGQSFLATVERVEIADDEMILSN